MKYISQFWNFISLKEPHSVVLGHIYLHCIQKICISYMWTKCQYGCIVVSPLIKGNYSFIHSHNYLSWFKAHWKFNEIMHTPTVGNHNTVPYCTVTLSALSSCVISISVVSYKNSKSMRIQEPGSRQDHAGTHPRTQSAQTFLLVLHFWKLTILFLFFCT